MSGRKLVERLEADFRRIETPLPVIFDSPEDARALVLWIGCPFLRRDPIWTARIAPAINAICAALNAPDHSSPEGSEG